MTDSIHTSITTHLPNTISIGEWESYADPIEVVNGEVIILSPPQLQHALIARLILFALYDYLKTNPVGEVLQDNTPYILEGDEREDWVKGSRIPDVSYISNERMSTHREKYGNQSKYLHLSPDLAVEIISEHDRYSEITQKIADYLKHGSQLVWIIDPQTHTVRVHTADNPDGYTLNENDTLKGDTLFPNWELEVKTIFDVGN